MSKADPVMAQVLISLLLAGRLERRRVCQVLHDDVGQTISAVGLQLELLRMDYENSVPEIASRTSSIQKLLEGALNPLRELVSQLDPSPWTPNRCGKCVTE
jgi:signal transduction histidine kinase